MKASIALALGTTFLVGCASPAQQAARFEQNFAYRVQTYGASCEKIGFKRDTDPWRHCVMTASPYQQRTHH